MSKIRGNAVKKTLDFIVREYGAEVLQLVLERLPEKTRFTMQNPMARPWIGMEDYQKLLEAVACECFDKEAKSIRAVGAGRLDDTLRGVRRLFSLTGPKYMAKTFCFFCELQMNIRGITILDSGENFLVLQIPGDDQEYPFFWEELSGSLGRSIEISGGKDVNVSYEIKKHGKRNDLKYRVAWS
jgi:hypothetical protein